MEESSEDKYNYKRSLCQYGYLELEFYDADAGGYFCFLFFNGRKKYCLEAMRLQLQIFQFAIITSSAD